MRAVVGWCRPPSRDLRAGHGSTTCPFGVLGGRHRRIDIPPLPRASTAGGARGRNKDPAAYTPCPGGEARFYPKSPPIPWALRGAHGLTPEAAPPRGIPQPTPLPWAFGRAHGRTPSMGPKVPRS